MNGVPLDPKPTLDDLIDAAIAGQPQTFTRPHPSGEERPVAVLLGYEQYLTMRKATTVIVGLKRLGEELDR